MGKKSQSTTVNNMYGDTTTSNPYAWARTNHTGTLSGFKDGTALNSVYDFVNKSIDTLLDQYMNPTLNSTTNQAKLNSFAGNLNSQTGNNLENEIINPLSARNMIRSSQATDLYKNLSDKNIAAISDFANNLLASSQEDTAKMLTNLLTYYMQGANYLSDIQDQSIKTSSGNSTRVTNGSGNNSDAANAILKLAIQSAMG